MNFPDYVRSICRVSIIFAPLTFAGVVSAHAADDFVPWPWSDVAIGSLTPNCALMPDCDPQKLIKMVKARRANGQSLLHIEALNGSMPDSTAGAIKQLKTYHLQKVIECLLNTQFRDHAKKCFGQKYLYENVLDPKAPLVTGTAGMFVPTPSKSLQQIVMGNQPLTAKTKMFLGAYGVTPSVLKALAEGQTLETEPRALTPLPPDFEIPTPRLPVLDPICTMILCAPEFGSRIVGICKKCLGQIGSYFAPLRQKQSSGKTANQLLKLHVSD